MKKLILITLLVIVLGIFAISAYIYLNADSLLARLKPELERIATQTMKTPVQLGELHLGIGLKPTITVDGVSVGDTENKRALSVKSVLLALDLMPLLSKELKITELKVERPHITAIKTDGVVKIIGLPDEPAAAAADDKSPRSPASSQRGSGEKLPIAFALEKFILSDGEIEYEDSTPGAPLPRVEIKDLSVTSELTIADNKLRLNDATISTTINQSLPVSVTVDQISYNMTSTDTTLERVIVTLLDAQTTLNGALNANDMKGQIAFSSPGFDLSKLTPLHSIVPALKQFPLSGMVSPEFSVSLAGATAWNVNGNLSLKEIATTVNNMNLSALSGTVKLKATPQEQSAQSDDLDFTFQGSPMKLGFAAGLKGKEAILERLDLTAFSGAISVKADTSLSKPQLFKTNASVSSLNIEQALTAMGGQKESPLSGIVENVTANLSGELGERLKDSSGGRITFRIKDALLKQVNLAHEAFKGILSIPIIGDKITNSIPEEFREELDGKDTKIRHIRGTLNGAEGTFSTNDFTLLGSFFSIRGAGTMSMSGAVDLQTSISFNDRFSKLLVERVKELRSLLDRNGELTFPLSISGTAPKLTIIPDTKALAKLAAEAAVREGAQRLLEGAFKNKGGNSGDPVKGLGNLLGF